MSDTLFVTFNVQLVRVIHESNVTRCETTPVDAHTVALIADTE